MHPDQIGAFAGCDLATVRKAHGFGWRLGDGADGGGQIDRRNMLRQLQGILTGDEAAMQPPAEYLGKLTVLRAGEAEGRLLSCCLSLLVCAVGTPLQPQTRDTLVFLEDRGERLYAIDRMLTYLKLAGVL